MTWLRAFGRFFEQKIGLHRLGVLLSLIIITVAAPGQRSPHRHQPQLHYQRELG
jgi:membrane associated rhomboid family serine protease